MQKLSPSCSIEDGKQSLGAGGKKCPYMWTFLIADRCVDQLKTSTYKTRRQLLKSFLVTTQYILVNIFHFNTQPNMLSWELFSMYYPGGKSSKPQLEREGKATLIIVNTLRPVTWLRSQRRYIRSKKWWSLLELLRHPRSFRHFKGSNQFRSRARFSHLWSWLNERIKIAIKRKLIARVQLQRA